MYETVVTTIDGRIMALVSLPGPIPMHQYATAVHETRQIGREAIRTQLMKEGKIDAATYMPVELVATHYTKEGLPHRFRFARL